MSSKKLLHTFVHSKPEEVPPVAGIGATASLPPRPPTDGDMETDEQEDGEESVMTVECVGISPGDQRWVASGGMDGQLKVWDVTTNPLLIEGEVGAVDDVVRVEPSALSDGSLIWLGFKPAGGGDTKVRLKVKATATVLANVVFLCDIIDNTGAVLTVDVNVKQKKFASAKFYINEIIYGDVDGTDYLADAYLAGIGVG